MSSPSRPARPVTQVLLVLVGAVLGTGLGAALMMGATGPTTSDERAGPSAPVASAPAGPTAASEPASEACLRAADGSEAVVDLAEDAVEAMADRDARRLQEVVDQMRAEDAAVRQASARCRAEQQEDGAAVPSPTAEGR